MKHVILLALCAVFSCELYAQDVQQVCRGAVKSYHIENPDKTSEYKWFVEPSDAGKIAVDEESFTSRVTVEWLKEGSISVYEVNTTGCEGEVSFVKVSFSELPKAQFDNAKNCYWDELHIEFSKTSQKPFNVKYSLDGLEHEIKDIDTYQYLMDRESGNYKLISVTDALGCTNVLEENNTAIVLPKFNDLIIDRE